MSASLERFAQWQLSRGSVQPGMPEIPPDIVDLLTARWEWEGESPDSRGNQEFSQNPLFWSGRYLEPVINSWLKDNPRPQGAWPEEIWPQGKQFAVCLTHDVDFVTYGGWLPRLRQIKRLLSLMSREGSGAKSWLRALFFKMVKVTGFSGPGDVGNKGSDKFDRQDLFGPWLALEARHGFRSTFFFFPDKISRYHPFDGEIYRYYDRVTFEGRSIRVTELMQEMDRRGWEVGLHGTYNSYDDAEELKRQKDQVEKVLQKDVVSTRQHHLHFDIRRTPKAQAQAGFKYDSTFGSNRIVGFRNGLAYPFYFYDLQEDRPLPILELPLHIQDVALLSPQHLDLHPSAAIERCKEMIDRVEATQGLITLLWHPNVTHPGRYPGWFGVYEELLAYISRKNAWVAPVGAIGQWWEQRLANHTIFPGE